MSNTNSNDPIVTMDPTQQTMWRLLARTGDWDARARVLALALDSVPTDERESFTGRIIAELLGWIDGTSEEHPDRDRLTVICQGFSDLADLIDGDGDS